MPRASSWVAATIALAASAWPQLTTPAAAQKIEQTLQKGRLAAFPAPSSYVRWVEGAGLYAGDANVSTRRAIAVVLGAPPLSAVSAGFKLPAFSVTGKVYNARMRATFNVTQVVGPRIFACIEIARSGAENTMFQQKQSGALTGPGTVTLSTDTITLVPGVQYEARAFLALMSDPGSGVIVGGVATITEIKWEY